MKKLNIIGQVYGHAAVVEEVEPYFSPKGKKDRRYRCTCNKCGSDFIARQVHLRIGKVKSCGCLHKEITSKKSKTHGDTTWVNGTPCISKEYNTWQLMKRRCLNLNDSNYHNYGGRGIKICQQWLDDYANFLEDMGRAPSPEHSIDRIDNDGNYEPSNCRWALSTTQARNTSRTKLNPDLVRYIRSSNNSLSAVSSTTGEAPSAYGVAATPGAVMSALAKELGVSRTTIWDVLNYKSWKDVS